MPTLEIKVPGNRVKPLRAFIAEWKNVSLTEARGRWWLSDWTFTATGTEPVLAHLSASIARWYADRFDEEAW
jgi:hypothetical protein